MSVTVGLDFGTRSTEIYIKGKGIVLREPTVAAVDAKGNVVAVGTEALLIRGRAPGTVTIRRPITDNEISDFNLAAETLSRFLEIAAPRARKHVYAAAKNSFGSRNREILRRALKDCRTGKVELIEAPVASLLGSGFGLRAEGETAHSGTILCDIGAGSIEASYIRGGVLLRSDSCIGGGESADNAIIAYLRRKYGLAVTSVTARELKHRLSLIGEPEAMTVTGLDGSTGMPRRITISSEELLAPCAPQIEGTLEAIRTALGNLPRVGTVEATADRIVIVGGGAMLPGIAEYLADGLEREILLPENPLDCTAQGLGMMIESR